MTDQQWTVQWWQIEDGTLVRHPYPYGSLVGALRFAKRKSGQKGICRVAEVYDTDGVRAAEFERGVQVDRVANQYGGFYRRSSENPIAIPDEEVGPNSVRCRDCEEYFSPPRRKGRRPVRCERCRSL